MPTNRVELKTAEEFMSGYTPVYQPIYPIFLDGAVMHESEVGVLNFRHVQAVGDIRSKRITPKDTEIKQIQVTDDKKSFNKYFHANQFRQSLIQNREGTEDVVAQVLDEHQAQYDEMFCFGDDGLNNGLFESTDKNYVKSASKQIAKADRLNDLYTKMISSVEEARSLGGRKVIFIYGEELINTYNGKFSGSDKPFATVLKEGIEDGEVTVVKVPKEITPAGENGWVIANLAHVKLHYTKLPELLDQDYNKENMYYWHNFMLGSCMLEVKSYGGVIKQPVTLEQ